jgi:hypothetical protein
MSFSLYLTIRFRDESIYFGHQFSLHSDFLHESKKPAFNVHGKYPEGDYVVFGSDELIYD